MGIPSYFTNLIRKHGRVVKPIHQLPSPTHFYLDSNSIIYDCLRNLQQQPIHTTTPHTHPQPTQTPIEFERRLCRSVCRKIDEYIQTINQNHTLQLIYIAFDGVAPVAKLQQQRTRRHRSNMVSQLLNNSSDDNSNPWDKTAITPGTTFMANLARHTKRHFLNTIEFPECKIVVSASDEPGEGEHKIFDHIRANDSVAKSSHVIYGLDADLIMLCLNNLALMHRNQNKFYLFRETPEFIKTIDKSLKPNENYFLNIQELSNEIIRDMDADGLTVTGQNSQLIHDYILICFFLGNDFLPHFPSINIRTNGIRVLVSTYLKTNAQTNKYLTYFNDRGEINIRWGNLRNFIECLSGEEYELVTKTYAQREKKAKFYRNWRDQKWEEFGERNLDVIPYVFRDAEKYINPYHSGWERRYYETLFHANYDKRLVGDVCENFLQGLEWVLKYYTNGCVDWTWEYRQPLSAAFGGFVGVCTLF